MNDLDKNELAALRKRIDELKDEAAQWQESCGQNYVRATEAEMREEKLQARIEELEAIVEQRNVMCSDYFKRIAKLEAALTMISKAEAHKHDWVTVEKLIDQYALVARKALEKGNGNG